MSKFTLVGEEYGSGYKVWMPSGIITAYFLNPAKYEKRYFDDNTVIIVQIGENRDKLIKESFDKWRSNRKKRCCECKREPENLYYFDYIFIADVETDDDYDSNDCYCDSCIPSLI